MAKVFWSYQQKDQHTDLYILEEIAGQESWWVDTVTPQSFRRQLFGVTGELHVWLNSPGGDAFAGAAIYDMLREYSSSGRGKTVAMVSTAASAASLIAMACDEIRISILGTMMIHEPWSLTAGPAREHAATAKVLESIRDAQIDAYALRTRHTREEVLELMQGPDGNGTYMNAKQALELGFADSMIDNDDGTLDQMVRSLNALQIQSAMRNAAEILQAAAAALPPAPEADPESKAKAENAAARNDAMRALYSAIVNSY